VGRKEQEAAEKKRELTQLLAELERQQQQQQQEKKQRQRQRQLAELHLLEAQLAELQKQKELSLSPVAAATATYPDETLSKEELQVQFQGDDQEIRRGMAVHEGEPIAQDRRGVQTADAAAVVEAAAAVAQVQLTSAVRTDTWRPEKPEAAAADSSTFPGRAHAIAYQDELDELPRSRPRRRGRRQPPHSPGGSVSSVGAL
jgi:hypothetical protein